MEALNQQERKSAYTKFLLLYIVTTLVIIAGVFFGTRVPLSQNQMMQAQLMKQERARLFRDNFYTRMSDVKLLLDTVNQPGVQANLIDAQMDQKLAQLTAMVETDSMASKDLFKTVIKALYDSKDDKAKLRASAGTANTSAEKDKIIADLKGKLTEYAGALTNCQNQLIQLNR